MPVNPVPFRHDFTAASARCALQLYGVAAGPGREIAQRIEQRVTALAARWNFQARDSWLNQAINARSGPSVALAADDACLLAQVHAHASRTRGAVDVTLATFAVPMRRVRTTYDAVVVRRRLAGFTGLERWRVDDQALRFDNDVTRLDLGALVRAHAVDESVHIARDAGVVAGFISHGGDVFAFGRRPGQEPFAAAVLDPAEPRRILCRLELHDQALATALPAARRPGPKGGDLLQAPAGADAGWLAANVVSGSTLASALYGRALLVRADIDLPAGAHALAIAHDHSVHRLRGTVPA